MPWRPKIGVTRMRMDVSLNKVVVSGGGASERALGPEGKIGWMLC
jgi:hypothetical protein